jgi:hypothetical protein
MDAFICFNHYKQLIKDELIYTGISGGLGNACTTVVT